MREPDDDAGAVTPDADGDGAKPGRVKGALSGWRTLARIAYRDPGHVAERLTLLATNRQGEAALAWAHDVREQRPDTAAAVIAEDLRMQSAQVARVDGAIAGTPFLVALVPGYLNYLWQEARMVLRTAALYGHDPRTLRAAAQMLVLRGVHPTVEAAEDELRRVIDVPLPDKPATRRPLRTWVRSVYALLIFGGFMSAPSDKREEDRRPRLKAAAGMLIAGIVWVTTWVFPVTFMVAMAWACETHARQLGRRALIFYDGDAETAQAAIAAAKGGEDRGHDKRAILRSILLFLSLAVPILFIAYSNHIRQTSGVDWVVALGGLAALSLVIAVAVFSSRR